MVILVVDDTTILRSVLKDILVEFCEVQRNSIHEASDGVQAVLEYKRLKPDLVFLDISMPRLNGIDTVKQILEVDRHAQIVMCTGAGERSIVKECIRAGAVDYLVKPLLPIRVAEAVRKIMGDSSIRPETPRMEKQKNKAEKEQEEVKKIIKITDPVKIGDGADDSED